MKKVDEVMSVEEAKQLIKYEDPAGVPALCEALKNDVTTTKLDLGYLRICDEGAAALAEALKVNCALKELRLKDSRICLLYTSPSPRDQRGSRMPSSA